MRLFSNIRSIVLDAIAFARNLCRSRSALAAENLFLRKQLEFMEGTTLGAEPGCADPRVRT